MMRTACNLVWFALLMAVAAGCHGGDIDPGSRDGTSNGKVDGGNPSTADGPLAGRCGDLLAIVRDFKAWNDGQGHPDFEAILRDEPGYDFSTGAPQWKHSSQPYLATELDADGKPRYLLGAAPSPEGTIHGEEGFRQWYRDVDGVNQQFKVPIPDQDPAASRFVFDSAALPGGQFFPLDGQGFGNEGESHNYHFTTELRGIFLYEGGEVFSFSGDDDVYVFVNGKLALDLGGVHGVRSAAIDFDAMASWLGIVKGREYPIVLFHAERFTEESNFRFETSIRCFLIE